MLLSNRTLFQHKMSLKGRSCWVVSIRIVRAEELSLEAMGRLVAASQEIRFGAEDRQQLYLLQLLDGEPGHRTRISRGNGDQVT